MNYPVVIGEFDTIAAVAAGKNLGRLGDGELKVAYGSGYCREPENAKLTEEMREVIQSPHENCLVGIPTMDPRGPKYQNWTRHMSRFSQLVNRKVQYYSAFVSRPDSAPWIRTREYALSVQALWLGKRTIVVCERKGSIFGAVQLGALKAKHVECPHTQAYAVIDDLERAVCVADPEIAILSAGPTATCLANRLARRGVHAVDLGSAGRFLREVITE